MSTETEFNNYKRFMYVINIIKEESDERTPISNTMIKEFLKEKYNIGIETRTIVKIIDSFNETSDGDYIIKVESKTNGKAKQKNRYYYYNPAYVMQFGEAKAFVDMVYSSKFFSRETKELILENMQTFFNKRDGDKLRKNIDIHVEGNENTDSFYFTYEKICEAITQRAKLSFDYSKPIPGIRKPRRKRKMNIWPIETTYENNTFYLQAFDESENMIKTYRIDFISNIDLKGRYTLTEKMIQETKTKILESTNAYGADRHADLEITFKKDLYTNMIDKFGDTLNTVRYINDDTYSILIQNCPISEQFYGWIVGFGGRVKISGAKDQVEEFNAFLQKKFLKE